MNRIIFPRKVFKVLNILSNSARFYWWSRYRSI